MPTAWSGHCVSPDTRDLRRVVEELARIQRLPTSPGEKVAARLSVRRTGMVLVDNRNLLPHYHLDSDLPEHLDYDCVADAARLAEAVARTLAQEA
jgi:hypothetical protein